jgi:hypothetical protein
MAAASIWGVTPRESIEAECARRGRTAVVEGCVKLLRGARVDDALVYALAGPPAAAVLAGRDKPYWFRVWGARGLLWAWDGAAADGTATTEPSASAADTAALTAAFTDAVTAALSDEHWRVREMAAKVVAAHAVDKALSAVSARADDPNPRVRAAAARALVALASSH